MLLVNSCTQRCVYDADIKLININCSIHYKHNKNLIWYAEQMFKKIKHFVQWFISAILALIIILSYFTFKVAPENPEIKATNLFRSQLTTSNSNMQSQHGVGADNLRIQVVQKEARVNNLSLFSRKLKILRVYIVLFNYFYI